MIAQSISNVHNGQLCQMNVLFTIPILKTEFLKYFVLFVAWLHIWCSKKMINRKKTSNYFWATLFFQKYHDDLYAHRAESIEMVIIITKCRTQTEGVEMAVAQDDDDIGHHKHIKISR